MAAGPAPGAGGARRADRTPYARGDGTTPGPARDDERGGHTAMTAANGRQAGASRGDTVCAVLRQWQTVHPDLDTGPMEVIGLINRCDDLRSQADDASLRRAGLSRA